MLAAVMSRRISDCFLCTKLKSGVFDLGTSGSVQVARVSLQEGCCTDGRYKADTAGTSY